MENDYMTEEEEKEYGTMRRAKVAGFSLQDDRLFTAKSSPIPRWEQLTNNWVRNKTMTESELNELEKYIPNHSEVLTKYVEECVEVPSYIKTPQEFIDWVKGGNISKPNYKVGIPDWKPSLAYPNIESVSVDLKIGDVPVEPTKFNQRLEEAGLNPKEIADEWYPYDMSDPYIVKENCNVNSPKHYMLFPDQGIEVIDVRKRLMVGLEKKATAYQIDLWSRAWEYLTRCWEKNGEEDIKKAQWYLNRLVTTFEE